MDSDISLTPGEHFMSGKCHIDPTTKRVFSTMRTLTRDSETEAYQLAHRGICQLFLWAGSHATRERQEIQAANQPQIAAAEAKRDFLIRKRCHLEEQIERLHAANGPHQPWAVNLVIAVFLTLAGFGLIRLTLEPFNLGPMADLFSAGLAVILPFSTDRFLRQFPWHVVLRALSAITFGISLVALVAVAGIRADVFERQIQGGDVVVLDDTPESAPVEQSGSNRVGDLLRLAMVSAALGLELSSGLAWNEVAQARRNSPIREINRIERELLRVYKELLAVNQELHRLLSEPGRTYSRFLLDFQRGLTDGIGQIGRSGFLGAMLVVAMMPPAIQGANKLHLIAAVDLTKTEAAVIPSGRSEFEENLRSVRHILAALPADSKVSVIGITDRTFTTPFVILSGRITADPGYFSTRLNAARQRLASEWDKRAKELSPSFLHTDVLGVFLFAASSFSNSDSTTAKVLVLLSDMRHEEPGGFDLERPDVISVTKAMRYVERNGLLPNLGGAQIYIFGLGAHTGARTNMGWAPRLRQSVKALLTDP